MASIPRIKLGTQGFEVSKLGLGCMGLSAFYGTPVAEEDGISLIHHAFNRGITFFDTADMYGPFTNEVLVGKALKGLPREKVQLATKFGNVVIEGVFHVKGSAEYVRKACEDSLKRLDVDYIDLYYQHRVDTTVPIEETVGELKKLVQEGKVKYIGLSEANVDTIRRANAVHPITAVQLEWSLWTRDVEDDIIPTCRDLGIGIVPYSPLGRGFFAGKAIVENLQEGDSRLVRTPRFQGENFEKNKVLFERVSALAKKHGYTPAQLALAWVLHQGSDVAPIPENCEEAGDPESILLESQCFQLMHFFTPLLVCEGHLPIKDDVKCLTDGFMEQLITCIIGMLPLHVKDLPTDLRHKDILEFSTCEVQAALEVDFVLLNTFDELDRPILDTLQEILPTLYTVGPLVF